MFEDLDRRALMARAIYLLGGATALGACGKHTEDAEAPDAGDEAVGAPPAYFSQARFAILMRVADLLIPDTDTPGALAVGVPQTVDMMVASWASNETRAAFDGVLDAINGEARAQFANAFTNLAPDQQLAVYEAYDKAAIENSPKMPPMPWRVAIGPYPRFKELLLMAYYLSETGATEELRHEIVPGPFEGDIAYSSIGRSWAY